MSNSPKKSDNATEENQHHPNPPGNPMLKQDDADLEKSRQQEFAAIDDAKASQTANLSKHSNSTKHPIKQPNKTTNNS